MDHPKPQKTIKKRKFYKPVPKPVMAKRYATVRFFEGWNVEKRKILRKIEQLEKRIATAKLVQASKEKGENDEGNVEELQKELEKWKRDEIYVNFYPKREKYISLYPKNNPEQSAEKREEMRGKAEEIERRIIERKKPKVNQDTSPEEDSEEEDDESQKEEGEEEDDFFM